MRKKAGVCLIKGDEFGYSLFPLECYEYGDLTVKNQILEQAG